MSEQPKPYNPLEVTTSLRSPSALARRARTSPLACIRVHPLVLLVLGAISCSGSPWNASDAPKAPPDEQFRTGVEVGYDAWVWYCYEGKRIVITQASSACFGGSPPRTSTGPCGKPLAVEEGFPRDRESRHPIPDGYRWPGSKPVEPSPAITSTLDAGTLDAAPADAR